MRQQLILSYHAYVSCTLHYSEQAHAPPLRSVVLPFGCLSYRKNQASWQGPHLSELTSQRYAVQLSPE